MKKKARRPFLRGMSVEEKYMYFAAAVVLVFVLAAAVIAICSRGGRMCAGSSEDEPVFVSLGQVESLEFFEDSYFLSPDSQLTLELRTQPEVYDEVITWSSSDASVLRVDENGVVTACSHGTARITATAANCSDTVVISVADDLLVAAVDCVKELADRCDESTLSAALSVTDRLEDSSVENAAYVSNVIKSIVAYTDGGDRAALDEAIIASGIDGYLCRRAAASCWAYGEMNRSGAVISFVGDCTLARYNESGEKGRFPSVYEASGSLTYPFDRVKGVFAADHMTIVNFEGTLTESTEHRNKNYFFRGDPEYARMLPASSIEAANLANNHSRDYHQQGYDDTMRHLSMAGVRVLAEEQPLTTTLGQNISVVMLAATSGGETYTDTIHSALLEGIRRHKSDDNIVAVNLHWGTEGSLTPERWQRDAARELIDAGADLIVGHHSHTMQGIEIYNGKYIAYSLGNFAFGGKMSVSYPETLILRARLDIKDGKAQVSSISVLPCRATSASGRVNNYQPQLCFRTDGDMVYEALLERSKAIDGVTAIDRPDI